MPAFAADMTVKGEVVDVACSMAKKEAGKGAAHASCAMVCAKKGQPVGILTADAIYTVTGDYAANNNAKLLDFVAKNVIVTGEVTEKDGVRSRSTSSRSSSRTNRPSGSQAHLRPSGHQAVRPPGSRAVGQSGNGLRSVSPVFLGTASKPLTTRWRPCRALATLTR